MDGWEPKCSLTSRMRWRLQLAGDGFRSGLEQKYKFSIFPFVLFKMNVGQLRLLRRFVRVT
jgi:hypothetical protein